MSETEKKKAPGYTVMVMDETSDYELRAEAVTAAKEASNAGARRVEIQDGAKRELMTYRDGRLVEYVYESRGLRRDRPPREERPPRDHDDSRRSNDDDDDDDDDD